MTTVGGACAFRLSAALAAGHGVSALDVADAHSRTLGDLARVVFTRRGDGFRRRFCRQFAIAGPDLLLLDHVVLHPRWRGLKLGLLAVRKLLDLLGGGCGLAVAKMLPPHPGVYARLRVPPSWVPGSAGEDSLRAGAWKLRRHFERMGFEPLRGTPYHALSPAAPAPGARDLLRPARVTLSDM
jgi:hypothetical protein